jgi:hypothetical protein
MHHVESRFFRRASARGCTAGRPRVQSAAHGPRVARSQRERWLALTPEQRLIWLERAERFERAAREARDAAAGPPVTAESASAPKPR